MSESKHADLLVYCPDCKRSIKLSTPCVHVFCRIVACVNGCAGINPEAVPELLSALKSAASFGPSMDDQTITKVMVAIAKAEATS